MSRHAKQQDVYEAFIAYDGFQKEWRSFIKPMKGFDSLLKMAKTRQVDIGNMCEMPVLTFGQEQYLFRQYNCLKYLADRSRQNHVRNNYIENAKNVRDVLILCNMRLAVNFLKKKRLSPEAFQDAFSDASTGIMRAVDKFNFSFGYKFSTYASWVLIKSFVRIDQDNDKDQMNFYDPATLPEIACDDDMFIGLEVTENNEVIAKLFNCLEAREIDFIMSNMGLTTGVKETLEDIGHRYGISKERVRQVKHKAMRKLREVAKVKFPALAEAI